MAARPSSLNIESRHELAEPEREPEREPEPQPGPRAATIAIYADVNPNLIDGSTVWLQSVALCWLRVPETRVILVVREPVSNGALLEPVRAAGAVIKTLDELSPRHTAPAADGPTRLEHALERLDAEEGVDVFLVRGEAHLARIARNDSLRKRLWGYWLRRPRLARPSDDVDLLEVAEGVDRLLVQSDAWRAVLETVFGVPPGKVLVLPPMVPDEAWEIDSSGGAEALVYSGKLDIDYNVEQYLSLPAELARSGLDIRVDFIGDKFNRAEQDPQFVSRMQARLESTEGVIWHRGVERRTAIESMSRGLFGLCWRSSRYDTSLELSTKLLEFCALGVPPLVNRTEIHAELLGEDYPYFVSSCSDIARAVADAKASPSQYQQISRRVREIARRYSFARAASRLEDELRLARSPRPCGASGAPKPLDASASTTPRKRRVVIASHDNKFLSAVLRRLEHDPALEIRYDHWHTARGHDEKRSRELLDWADVVFCEWCAGAAVWYSRRVSPHQKCYVRLHRFEAFEKEPREVDFDKVDRLIVVSEHFKQLCAAEFGVAAEKIDVLPQYVDWQQFHRPKHASSEHTLGLVGINSFFHKRFDRALDVLRELRAEDRRWRLRIRTVLPWEIGWVWNRAGQAEQFREHFGRLVDDPLLRDAVFLDPPGNDMPEWFRHIGFILSTSDSEGCHTSVAEGMASGAIPAIHRWPGADSVYPAEFVFDSVGDLARFLLSVHERRSMSDERARVSRDAERFDVENTRRFLTGLLTGASTGSSTGSLTGLVTGLVTDD